MNNYIKKSKENSSNKRNTLCVNDRYMERKDKITSFFLSKDYRPMTRNELAGVLNIKREDRNILENILNELCDSRKDYFRQKKKVCFSEF
ncbi:MAG: hypothetical protein K0R72_1091 [Clostridia bacterium]|jgi:hypothetical protein|nr:hypothetical protein [Clostridia bacterium]